MIKEKEFRANFDKTAMKELNEFLGKDGTKKVISIQKVIDTISNRSDQYVYTVFYEEELED